MLHKLLRFKATIAFLAALTMSLLGGCGAPRYHNHDFMNSTTVDPAKSLVVVVIIPGATAFPAVKPGTWSPSTPTIEKNATGRFTLTFTGLNVPFGKRQKVSVEFVSGQRVDLENHTFVTDPNKRRSEGQSPVPGIGMVAQNDAALGLVLKVFNAASAPLSAITFQELQWTVANTQLSADQMAWDDPALESLPWEVVTASPFDLAPGDTSPAFDVPDAALPGNAYYYVRYRATTPDWPDSTIQRGAVSGEIDAVTATERKSWGGIKRDYF